MRTFDPTPLWRSTVGLSRACGGARMRRPGPRRGLLLTSAVGPNFLYLSTTARIAERRFIMPADARYASEQRCHCCASLTLLKPKLHSSALRRC
jgi:hypothetical protein